MVTTTTAAASSSDAQEPSSETFMLENEDHTLANALRFFLNKNPHVEFCGYSSPHPADDVVNVRIQTTGEISAAEALRQACRSCQEVCAHVNTCFKDAVARKHASMSQ
ncbi:hypothetical protein WJX73_009443 [Symbiochloris irregularis]|uniref:DNA-directed RNA polymerases I and III subunit RPAC2 n=1 Tax=Symbiochloris irregularis TaxID=706552 RepID=A0AAW1P1T1_9CHLO